MKALEWILVIGGVAVFIFAVVGTYKMSQSKQHLPTFSTPTPQHPFQTGPMNKLISTHPVPHITQIDYQPPATFGGPTPQNPFQTGPMDKFV